MTNELKKTGFGVRSMTLAVLAAGCLARAGFSQTAYFADGYHGGIHGHYPDWVTRFMVDKLKQHPRWKINLEIEPETWDRVRTNDAAAYNEFKALVADQSSQGRIEFVNPGYAQSYLWNIAGESVIRQFLFGIRKVREHFPEAEFTTYASEEPCFTSALPGILKSLGFKNAVLKNPDTCWGGYTRAFGGELINWVGPDGTAILTVPRYAIESLQPRSTWQTIAWNNSPAYLDAAREAGIARPVGMCLQDAGWKNGPWLGEGTNSSRRTEYVTWRGYFENTVSRGHPEDWQFNQEDVLVSLVWGSQVLQKLAQQVRSAENELIMAEKLAAMASFYAGAAWPSNTLDEAWKNLMLAQHHDCWIVPYNGQAGNTWADKVTHWTGATKGVSQGIMQQAISALSGKPENQGSIGVRVFNTLGIRRNDLVNVVLPADWPYIPGTVLNEENREIPAQLITRAGCATKVLLFEAEAPSLGYSSYQIQRTNSSVSAGAGARILDDGTCKLETDLYRIMFDPSKGGVITSLLAKTLGNKEFVDGANARGFNEIRGFFHDEGRFHSSVDTPATIKIIENGPVRVCLEVSGKVGRHPFTQTVSVAKSQRRIEFNLQLDWVGDPGVGASYGQKSRWRPEEKQRAFYDDREKLLALFPANLKAQKISKNAPFDVTDSKLTDTFFTTWDGIKNNVILHWMDVAEASGDHGLALLTDHTTSYIHGADQPPGLVLQYSGIGLWGRHYGIAGPTAVHYALVPHAGRWDKGAIPTESAGWNEPLVAALMSSSSVADHRRRSMADITATEWEVTSLQFEGESLLVRLFNAEGDGTPKQLRFDGHADKVQLVELNGRVQSRLEPITDAANRTAVALAIPRFGIRTLRFDGFGQVPLKK